MLEVLHELVDAVHSLKAITGNRRAELHELLDKAAEPEDAAAETQAEPEAAHPGAGDVPAGA